MTESTDRCDAELAAIAALPRDLSLEERIGAEHGCLDWNEEKSILEQSELNIPCRLEEQRESQSVGGL